MAVPAKGTGDAGARASRAHQELKEGWPGTLVTAGACESPWWEGLGVGQVCGAPSLAPQPYRGAGEVEVMSGGCPQARRKLRHLLSHSAVSLAASQTAPACLAAQEHASEAAGAHQLASSWFPHPEDVLAELFTADLALALAQPVPSRGCVGPVAAPRIQEPCDTGTWFMPIRALEYS